MSDEHQLDYEISPESRIALGNIAIFEGHLLAAAENIRREIGGLIGCTIPFDHHGHTQWGRVTAVRGHGTTYRLRVLNFKTGVERDVATSEVLLAARRLQRKQRTV